MSDYYLARKTKGLFDPSSKYPFKMSRSKIDLFLNCQRCFYLDRRLGVSQPPGYPFNLNSAVDHLLKKEFDFHRAKGEAHPLMKYYGIEAVPFSHEMMDVWRENFKGVEFVHERSGFLVTGAVDDIWQDSSGDLIIVDYKSTAKDGEVTLDAEWQIGYKRQMEIYQWLFRQNGFQVSSVGYFVYCNGKRDNEAFDAKLEFDIKLIPYTGDDSWIESALLSAKECLLGNQIPQASGSCDYCAYRNAAHEVESVSAPPVNEIKKITKKSRERVSGRKLF